MYRTRTQATKEIHSMQLAMESKPMAIATVYKRLKKLPNGSWCLKTKDFEYVLGAK